MPALPDVEVYVQALAARAEAAQLARVLADRVLSRLLKGDRPRTADDLERPGTGA